jgi:hypothetical protein
VKVTIDACLRILRCSETVDWQLSNEAAISPAVRGLSPSRSMIWRRVGSAMARKTSLTLVTWFDEMPAGSLRGLVIDCADLQAEYQLLTERDVRFLGPPASQPGGTFATLVDPDGNHLSLRQTGSAPNV